MRLRRNIWLQIAKSLIPKELPHHLIMRDSEILLVRLMTCQVTDD